MPNLLSQLLNPALMASRIQQQQQQSTNPQEQTSTSLSVNPHHHQHHVIHQNQHNNIHNFNNMRHGPGAGAGAPTRLQFIVPGEQVDLYGIINSVFSDVLGPRRQSNMQQANNFHFQAPPM